MLPAQSQAGTGRGMLFKWVKTHQVTGRKIVPICDYITNCSTSVHNVIQTIYHAIENWVFFFKK